MISTLLVALIALLHVYILVLEMFFWDKPKGQSAFGLTPEFSRQTRVMAANQGLYNGFLAAGLITGLALGANGSSFILFFLLCIAVAGVFGAATSSRKILFIQTVPAVLALAAIFAGI